MVFWLNIRCLDEINLLLKLYLRKKKGTIYRLYNRRSEISVFDQIYNSMTNTVLRDSRLFPFLNPARQPSKLAILRLIFFSKLCWLSLHLKNRSNDDVNRIERFTQSVVNLKRNLRTIKSVFASFLGSTPFEKVRVSRSSQLRIITTFPLVNFCFGAIFTKTRLRNSLIIILPRYPVVRPPLGLEWLPGKFSTKIKHFKPCKLVSCLNKDLPGSSFGPFNCLPWFTGHSDKI